jgi:hypothetical protein
MVTKRPGLGRHPVRQLLQALGFEIQRGAIFGSVVVHAIDLFDPRCQ